MGGAGDSSGSSEVEVVGDLLDDVMNARTDEGPAQRHQAASAPPAQSVSAGTPGGFLSGENAVADLLTTAIDLPASVVHAAGATAPSVAGTGAVSDPAAGAQPPAFLDHIAFPDETDEQIAAGRVEDAEVAHAVAPVERLATYAELDKALDLHVLDTPETLEVAVNAATSIPAPEAAGRTSGRRFARLMTVLVLAVFAMWLLLGGPPGQQPAAVAPTGGVAAGVPGNAASAIPSAAAASAGAPTPVSAAGAAASQSVASRAPASAAPAAGQPGALNGAFDAASIVGTGTLLALLPDGQQYVTEKPVSVTYATDPAHRTGPAKLSGTFALTVTLSDEVNYMIYALGRGATGATSPPMPATWQGCTLTIGFTGSMTGAQKVSGASDFAGTASVRGTSAYTGCERAPVTLNAGPPETASSVPWTATGDASHLRGTIDASKWWPGLASILSRTWTFEVKTP